MATTLNNNNNATDVDEGNLLQHSTSRFMKMVTTRPKEISEQVVEWTSQQTPAQGHAKEALAALTIPQQLHKGIKVTKISSYGKFKKRIITIAQDKFALFITHERIHSQNVFSHYAHKLPLPLISRKGIRGFKSKKDLRELYVRYIDVADLQSVQVGVVDTQTLESSREFNRLKGSNRSTVDVRHEEIVTIFHHGNQTLNVLVPNAQDREALVSAIFQLVQTFQSVIPHVNPQARLLRYIWYDLDQNHDGHLDKNEFHKLLNRINLDPLSKTLFQDFQREHHIRGKRITYRQCMDLLNMYTTQGTSFSGNAQFSMELALWKETFGDEDYVSASAFWTFLKETQHEQDATLADVQALVSSVNSMELNRDESSLPVKEGHLSKFRFDCYLHHTINDAYHPDALVQSQDLSQSMSRYWINTSHNTYLTGDQLRSVSSVECYVRALQRGCKCLELDCWDGEITEDGTPIPVVFHGHTFTSKILFQDIVNCVAAYVKAHSDTFPIILSLENHCSKPFQNVMASCLKETLGGALYVPSGSDTSDGDLPSPLLLRGKVVIKGKRPPEPDDEPVATLSSVENVVAEENDNDDDPYSIHYIEVEQDKKSPTAPAEESVKQSSKIVPELAQLTLFHGTKYKAFETSIPSPPSHMHSISELKITKIIDQAPENAGLWRRYNLHHMTRTYPAGARVDSSNYNPVLAWAMGCQMVALNFQSGDTPLLLNDGRFRQNGNCGYVLKPPAVLGLGGEREATKRLKVRVLSGSCLPKPDGETIGEVIDPYVTVVVHDVVTHDDDSKKQVFQMISHSTAAINNNGYCPVWNETKFHEFAVEFPEVAMVQFKLMESDVTIDDKIADASIPFSCLRRGYRSIQLYDTHGTRTGPFSMATLLVEIDYE